MKKLFFLSLFILIINYTFGQIKINIVNGESVITKLGLGVKVNDGSSLSRDWIIINDESCPIQLNDDVGIETSYPSESYRFKAIGSVTAKEPIVAYEILHVLYNVFGEHIETLSNTEVIDIKDKKDFYKYASWYATENEISEYLICVSYVANVRTQTGSIWRYSYQSVKEKLDELKISFEKEYLPVKYKEKEK